MYQALASGRRSPTPTDQLDVRQCPQASSTQWTQKSDRGGLSQPTLNQPTMTINQPTDVISKEVSRHKQHLGVLYLLHYLPQDYPDKTYQLHQVFQIQSLLPTLLWRTLEWKYIYVILYLICSLIFFTRDIGGEERWHTNQTKTCCITSCTLFSLWLILQILK